MGRTRILILGGGSGGVYTALGLERQLKKELDRGEVELGLVNRDNYIVFQPMLPEVISGNIGILGEGESPAASVAPVGPRARGGEPRLTR